VVWEPADVSYLKHRSQVEAGWGAGELWLPDVGAMLMLSTNSGELYDHSKFPKFQKGLEFSSDR
jgi:hypothetical protein